VVISGPTAARKPQQLSGHCDQLGGLSSTGPEQSAHLEYCAAQHQQASPPSDRHLVEPASWRNQTRFSTLLPVHLRAVTCTEAVRTCHTHTYIPSAIAHILLARSQRLCVARHRRSSIGQQSVGQRYETRGLAHSLFADLCIWRWKGTCVPRASAMRALLPAATA